MRINIHSFILIFFVGISLAASGQRDTTMNREVEVIKAFKPSLNDAYKINDMPKIKETEVQKPVFNYNINSQPAVETLAVNPLKAASISSEKKEQNGYGLLRGGLGNYNKPYGEFFFNHLASKKSIFGIHAMHLSSDGNLKLEGGDKVKAPYSKNQAEVYYSQFLRENILSFNVDFNRDAFNYYGYPKYAVPDTLMQENQDINYFGTGQVFTKGGITIKMDNPSLNMKDPFFGFDFDYHYFKTKTNQTENYAKLMTHSQKPFNFGTGLLDAGVSYNQANHIVSRIDESIDSRMQSWLYLNPAVYFSKKTFNATLGIKTWYVSDQDIAGSFKITPNILLNYMPVKNIIKLFAGIDGNLIDNHYSKIAYENPFVNPEHDVKNSFEKIRFFGGFDGKFATKTNFKLGFDYAMIDNQPLYYLNEHTTLDGSYNPVTQIIDNDFDIMYDDMNRFKFNVELIHTASAKLNFLLNGNYYVYNMETQAEAWNMPEWDANFSVGYKITEQLSVSADIYLIGMRKALIIVEPNPYYEYLIAPEPTYKSFNLDTAFDMNVRGNYQITERFSVFAQLNNFGFQKYQQWFGYPVQSFNFLAGVSYAF